MKKLTLLIAFFFSLSATAEMIKFKAGNINGKIISESIDLTDWQAVMVCHYTLSGKMQEVMKYPNTHVKKLDEQTYQISAKAMSLFEALPNLDPINCAYKLILIGKLSTTHQNLFGEIILFGSETKKMSEKEFDILGNKDLLTKILNEKIKELSITTGNEGGIIAKSSED